ncbi:kelch-like protein 20 [Ananas comosus]|uniref:Kelch-like protein 20 n=1 Tax=Ananas comosus TaxID=4615 RepID=A0A6P5EAM9_ANACO|nr:kelch-like protein 20 [Ananas comosus]
MGAGRRTETITVSTDPYKTPMPGNSSVSARNLRKTDLGGVIFGCSIHTMSECLSKQLFGLPSNHSPYVKNIEPGLPLFLFNYSDKKLHGVFEAACHGQMCIDPYAWTKDGAEKTKYPAQVRIRTRSQCEPLLKAQYDKVIADNYYKPNYLCFELDHAQTQGLLALFRPTSVPPNIKQVPPTATAPLTAVKRQASNPWKRVDSRLGDSKGFNAFSVLTEDNNPLSDNWGDWDAETSSSALGKKETEEKISEWENSEETMLLEDPLVVDSANDDTLPVNNPGDIMPYEGIESKILSEEQSSYEINMPNILHKLKNISLERKCLISLSKDNYVASSSTQVQEKVIVPAEMMNSAMPEENASTSAQFEGDAKLLQIIEELRKKAAAVENKQMQSDQEVQSLRGIVIESEKKIQRLERQVHVLESKLYPSISLSSAATPLAEAEQAIYLMGGYNGTTWLSTLDCLSPATDSLVSLRPMSVTRSYASAVALSNNIFVFGGRDTESCFSTVECYNKRNDDWTMCPRLNRPKEGLAGATLNNKIFAIGGGNGPETFSEVEMLDPALSRWIYSTPLLHRRFAPGAVESGGVIYTVGGYDGSCYLQSAERYDPREGYWTRLPNMNLRRGCPSLAVLNGTIYAIGGIGDGRAAVSTVETFDPRLSSWMMGRPMNIDRAYFSAVVLDNVLFALGGLQGGTVLESVECYSGRTGWFMQDFRSFEKRSFFCAVVL